MAVFEYRGIQIGSGKSVKGVKDAENAKALRSVLRKDGILLTSATEEKAAKEKKKRNLDIGRVFGRVSTADIAVMTRQLATLVGAKIPLFEALSAMIDQVEKVDLRVALTNIRDQVREGTSFATALESHPRLFSGLYVNMVRAGESSGTLEAVLNRLTLFMENQARLKGKVIATLAYPAIMMLIAILIVSGLMIGIVPKVVAIFKSMGKALPLNTRILIGVSNIMAGYWWLILILLVGGFFLFRYWRKTEEGRFKWDNFVLRSPLFGKLIQMVAIARFSRTLGTLLSAGVPLLTAMGIVRSVLGNAALEETVHEATTSIREGESIAEPLKRSGRFPPLVTHMIAIGEKSGQLEEMLENVSDAYDSYVETRVQMLTSLLEPIIIVIMGGAVAYIAVSILFPLVQMSQFAN